MVLLIMAAGMGSRYGGIKQIEPVGTHGELIIDYSIYDAMLAGFDRVVFVIRRDIEKDFCEAIFNRIKTRIKAEYVFQDFSDLPVGFKTPQTRKKPWGTAHAILAARNAIKGEPFCVINADDFYGRQAYAEIAKFFKGLKAGSKGKYSLVGYQLGLTVSDQGTVSRGVCEVDESGYVTEINERYKVEKRGELIGYLEGDVFNPLRLDAAASMNFWGFTADLMPTLQNKFAEFLKVNINSEKAEYPIPVVIGEMLSSGEISLKMLKSRDLWLGFTYPEDKAIVKAEIDKLNKKGVYPTPLWK